MFLSSVELYAVGWQFVAWLIPHLLFLIPVYFVARLAVSHTLKSWGFEKHGKELNEHGH